MEKKCSKCKIIKSVKEFNVSSRNKTGYRCECRECQKLCYKLKSEYYKNKRKDRYKKNSDKELSRNKIYYKKNKSSIINQKKEKIKNNVLLRLISNLRSRLYLISKSKKIHKDNQTIILLGTDLESFKLHIEKQFTGGMSWDNYGQWHIDHIIPLSSAKNEDEVYKLCHYTNLQPLWATDNLKKGNKVLVNL